MKKNFINILLLVITAYTFEGCWGLGGNGSSGYNYTETNTDKFIKERNYEKEHPFTMRDEAINVPLLSQKGQVNWTTNFAHGFNTSLTVAVSNKVFIEGGGTYTKSNSSEQKSARFDVTNYYSNYDGTSSTSAYTTQNFYDFKLDLEGYSFNIGAGFYKTFGKNGRWNYHAGYANGSASSKYSYDIQTTDNISNRYYSFTEKRNYNQFFLQTDLGYETKVTEGAIVARTVWTHFTNQHFTKSMEIPGYEMQSNAFVLQPALHFAIGNNFKFFSQCGWNIPLGNTDVKWFSTNVQAGVIWKFRGKENF